MFIRNASALIENGGTKEERRARRLCILSAESALEAVEPVKLIRSKLRIAGKSLIAGESRIDLSDFRRVFVIGGGKAALAMADAVEAILGDRVTAGIVNVLDMQVAVPRKSRRIRLHGATHPLPSVVGQKGVEEMLELIGRPDEQTLVICLVSGGGSSLLPLPAEGVELADKVEVTRGLLRAGATIQELNVVRKHLSSIKGGRLAQRLFPARVLSLVISDVVGNRLDSIASGPLYPDPSTFRDARNILAHYDLWDSLPPGIKKNLSSGTEGKIPETPKPGSRYFEKVSNVIVGSNEDACEAAARYLRREKCRPAILTTSYEGEARSAGTFLGAIVQYGAMLPRPRSFVAGGETTVVVKGDGRGGRNQEFALSASMKISENCGVALISLGTDGLDGSTDAAGALVDGSTLARAGASGLSAEDALQRNDSYEFFRSLGDSIITGPTGTNVNDISIAVVV